MGGEGIKRKAQTFVGRNRGLGVKVSDHLIITLFKFTDFLMYFLNKGHYL